MDFFQIQYMMMDRDLSERLELAIRAVHNLTSVNYAYKDAKSFNWHAITPDRAYDQYVIPKEVLAHNPNLQRDYYNALSDHLAGYIEEVCMRICKKKTL